MTALRSGVSIDGDNWLSAISEVEDATHQGQNDQQVERRAGEEVGASCTYCGRALEHSTGGSGDNHMRVSVPCSHRRLEHVRSMLERADSHGMRSFRPEVLRRVLLRVGGGNSPGPIRRSLLEGCQ